MPSSLAVTTAETLSSEMLPPRVVSDPSKLRRVLIVKLSSLGDVVCALPLADSLRSGLGPEAKIVWAVRDKFAPLLHGNPNLTLVSVLKEKGAGGVMRYLRTLRALPGIDGPFDVALDAQGLFVSGMITRASGAPIRIGMDRNREGNALFLTHPVVPGKQRAHIVSKLLAYCDALGLPKLSPRPQEYLAQGQRVVADELLAAQGALQEDAPRIGLIVGASTPDKMWPVESWASLVKMLREKGAMPLLLGGSAEQEMASHIIELASGGVINLTGKTPLPLLASVMARCSVIVGGDSGPTHLAVGVGVPVVGLYGVTDPARTGPQWGVAPSITLDFAEKDAPPAARRPRHPTLQDALARIPAQAAAEAVEKLLGDTAR